MLLIPSLLLSQEFSFDVNTDGGLGPVILDSGTSNGNDITTPINTDGGVGNTSLSEEGCGCKHTTKTSPILLSLFLLLWGVRRRN